VDSARNAAALKTVAAIDEERALWILLPQRIDHPAQGRESSAPLEHRAAALIEEFIVRVELRVDVGGMQNTDALRAAAPARCERRSRREAYRARVLEEVTPGALRHATRL
jgi:hypothetical protein